MHIANITVIALVIAPILAFPHSSGELSMNAINRRHEPKPPSPDTQAILDRERQAERLRLEAELRREEQLRNADQLREEEERNRAARRERGRAILTNNGIMGANQGNRGQQ